MNGRQEGSRRKERIHAAARELFFKKGYLGTTVEQIAAQAGYSKRSVYLDYQNKDDLYVSIAAEGLALLLSQLQRIPRQEMPVREYISRYMEIIAVFSYEHPEYFRMFTQDVSAAMLASVSPPTRRKAAEIEAAGLELLSSALAAAVKEQRMPRIDPEEAAGILIGSVVGIVQLSMGGSQILFRKEALVDKVRRTGDLICKGLLQKD